MWGCAYSSPKAACLLTGAIAVTTRVVTNLDWAGGKLFDWHREKAGTVEHVHDEVKNGLAGGHVPSQLMEPMQPGSK
jgi:hypothetical protein